MELVLIIFVAFSANAVCLGPVRMFFLYNVDYMIFGMGLDNV